jgi:hypothetical protein
MKSSGCKFELAGGLLRPLTALALAATLSAVSYGCSGDAGQLDPEEVRESSDALTAKSYTNISCIGRSESDVRSGIKRLPHVFDNKSLFSCDSLYNSCTSKDAKRTRFRCATYPYNETLIRSRAQSSDGVCCQMAGWQGKCSCWHDLYACAPCNM